MPLLALDIGGANLKAADGLGYAASVEFALWKAPGDLSGRLRALIESAPPSERLAVTMTGELCDCFATKADGVAAILDAVESASGGRTIGVWLTDGRLASTTAARDQPLLAAASNWHALASYAVRLLGDEWGLLIDVGSTTTDVVPLAPTGPQGFGRTDPERLVAGELVYQGVERTPVCAIVAELPWQGRAAATAAELFAAAGDAYRWLGDLAEEPASVDTADGRPRTRAASHARLARMVCADGAMFSETDATVAAEAICGAQIRRLVAAIERVASAMARPPKIAILSGHGEFLVRRALGALNCELEMKSLAELMGADVSRCAPAHALAVLVRERGVQPFES